MQRPTYGQPPPTSPPLHHPVPQHVSTVPQLRSPPPPQPMSQHGSYASSPYQPQGNAVPAYGAPYSQFFNDPAAQVGFQVAAGSLKHGQEMLEQNLNKYINPSSYKLYFNVTNSYVVNKLFLVLFPWRHKSWSRKSLPGQEGKFLPPRDDLNSPDMYIPVMAFVTYILLQAVTAGLRGAFQPAVLNVTFWTAFFIVAAEMLALKAVTYFMSITNQSQMLDLVAYSGYKFVGVIMTLVISEVINKGKGSGGWAGWTVFIYTFLANALFLLRSLKYVLLPEGSEDESRGTMGTVGRAQKKNRMWFLFGYAYIVQFLASFWLCRA